MYKITEITTAHSKATIRDGFANAEAALAWIDGAQGIVQSDADSDFPGFYDVFTKHGRILAVEPMKD